MIELLILSYYHLYILYIIKLYYTKKIGIINSLVGDKMNIDLSKVDEKGIVLDDVISFNEEYLKKSQIKKLDNVVVKGRVYYSVTNEVVLDANCYGNMVLLDALTGEDVLYPFNINISEILSEEDDEKDQNELKTLDIVDILWQNIVLEVPISYSTKSLDDINKSGEGWELVDENEKKIDPRLAPLLELLDKEREE